MPLGVGSFSLFFQGPRSDLEVAYLNAVINGATVTVSSATVNPGEVSPGFSVVRNTNGIYDVTYPKCKYCKIIPVWSQAGAPAAANGFHPNVVAGFDPTAGTAQVRLYRQDGTTVTPVDPTASANELELIFLLGF